MGLIGYARVSTDDQDTEAQRCVLKDHGCPVIFQDIASGASKKRPELARCLEFLRPGDTLVVARLDRLGRSLSHLLSIIEPLDERGIFFRSLADPFDTTSAQGRLMMQMLGAFAEFERALIRERTLAGLAVAKARGKKAGNPRFRSKDAVAIGLMKATQHDTYLQRSRAAANQWRQVVEQLRPRLSWDAVTARINLTRGDNPLINKETLRRHVKRLVRAGEMSTHVLRAARPPKRSAAAAAALMLRAANPDASLRQLGELLEREGYHPPRAQRWSAQTVKQLLAQSDPSGHERQSRRAP